MSKENSLKKVNFLAMHDYFQIKNDWLKRESMFFNLKIYEIYEKNLEPVWMNSIVRN